MSKSSFKNQIIEAVRANEARVLAERKARAEKIENLRVQALTRFEIEDRMHALKDAAYSTFVRIHNNKYLFHEAKQMIEEISRLGGKEYDAAVQALLFGAGSLDAYREACDILLPLYTEENEHPFAEYESSDCLTRVA